MGRDQRCAPRCDPTFRAKQQPAEVVLMETLPELLSAAGIRAKTMRAGSSTKVICPKCSGGKTSELSLSLSIDADGQGAVAKCHRGTCGWTFGEKLKGHGMPYPA